MNLKKSTSELTAGVISLSSMLNKHGEATLYFGVKNDGIIIGQKDVTESTLRDISRKISSGIKPQVIPLIISKYGKDAFYISDNTIIVTIPINKELLENDNNNDYTELNDNEKKVLDKMKNNSRITISELVDEVNISESYVEKIIRKLKKEDYIYRVGLNKSGFWGVYKYTFNQKTKL